MHRDEIMSQHVTSSLHPHGDSMPIRLRFSRAVAQVCRSLRSHPDLSSIQMTRRNSHQPTRSRLADQPAPLPNFKTSE